MADLSSISGLSSLSGDLYYQYLINNNSTSTMLNALSGDSSESSDSSGLLGAVTSSLNTNSLSSLSGLGSLLGSDDDSLLGASQTLSSFSGILETYMNAQNAEAAQMSEKLANVLEEAAQTEDTSTLSYQTVQEIYQYFVDKTSSSESNIVQQSSDTGSASLGTPSAASGTIDADMDFDALERQIQESVEASLPSSSF